MTSHESLQPASLSRESSTWREALTPYAVSSVPRAGGDLLTSAVPYLLTCVGIHLSGPTRFETS